MSRAASAGDSPPYREWPKSSRMPTLPTSISSIASSVFGAEEKNVDTRGSRSPGSRITPVTPAGTMASTVKSCSVSCQRTSTRPRAVSSLALRSRLFSDVTAGLA
jgi:hypothetical protein